MSKNIVFKDVPDALRRYPVSFETMSDDLGEYRRGFPDLVEGARLIIDWLECSLNNPKEASYILHLGDSDAVALSETFWQEPYPVEFLQAHLHQSGLTSAKPEDMLQFIRLCRRGWLLQSGPSPMQYDWAPMEHVTIKLLKDFGLDFSGREIRPVDCVLPAGVKRKIRCASHLKLFSLGFFTLLKNRHVVVVGELAPQTAKNLASRDYWEANQPWMNVSDMPQSVYAVPFCTREQIKTVATFESTIEKIKALPQKPQFCLLACGMSAYILAPRLAALGITSIDIGSLADMICGKKHHIGGSMPVFAEKAE